MKKDEKEKANAEKAGMEAEKSSEAAEPETINEDRESNGGGTNRDTGSGQGTDRVSE